MLSNMEFQRYVCTDGVPLVMFGPYKSMSNHSERAPPRYMYSNNLACLHEKSPEKMIAFNNSVRDWGNNDNSI